MADGIKIQAINLSWKKVLETLNDPDVSEQAKLNIAMKICEKTCPQEIKVEGKLTHVLAERLGMAERKHKQKVGRMPVGMIEDAKAIAAEIINNEG